MSRNLLSGELVRLSAENPDVMAGCFSRWNQDTGWLRYLDTDPPRLLSEKKRKEWLEKDLDRSPSNEVYFAIRALENDLLIGFIGLFDLYMQHGDTLGRLPWASATIGVKVLERMLCTSCRAMLSMS